MSINKWILLLSFAAIGLGCSGKTIKEDKLREVKRVAVVGFDAQRQRPVSGGDLLSIAMKATQKEGATPRTRKDDAQTEVIYAEFAQQLAAKTKWQIVPLKDIRNKPGYAAIFKSKTEGFQNRPMVEERYDLINVPGLMDTFAIMTLKPEQQKEIQKELGVDAIVFVTVKLHLNNSGVFSSLIGKGKFSPIAVTSLNITDPRSDEKLWVDTVEGAPVDSGEENFMGMANEAKLNQTYNQAAKVSFEALLKNAKVTR